MKISLTQEQRAALLEFLKESEDVEALGGEEYTMDVYEVEPPMTLQIEMGKDWVDVLAAAVLQYDEGLDGWYLSERIEGKDEVEAALGRWLG